MIALLLSSLIIAHSQDSVLHPLPFQHITKKEGLSNSAITSVYMDKNDFVWFGTWDGANRYEGSTIYEYKPNAFVPGSISNNIVRTFLEDRNGDLWIVTHKGINRYKRDTDAFQNYLANFTDIPILENSIRACRGPDTTLWVTVLGHGINRYDSISDSFIKVQFKELSEAWLKSVVGIGSAGGLLYLLGADGVLVCILQNTVVFKKTVVSPARLGVHHFFRYQNNYGLALSTPTGGLLIQSLTELSKPPEVIALSDFPISSISSTMDNTGLWIGTELGDVFKLLLNGSQLKVIDCRDNFSFLAASKRKILAITETKQDLLWIGTDGDGVFKFLTKNKAFFSVPIKKAEKSGLSNNIVRSVYEDPSGTLYVGTRGGGLNILAHNQPTRILNTQKGLSNNTVLALTKDKAGNLWIGTDGEGIDMLEATSGRLLHFPRDFRNKADIRFGNIYAICIDAYGTLWLGTSGYGVISLAISKTTSQQYVLNTFKQIANDKEKKEPQLKSNVVYAIVEETPNILWFGTRGAGVYRYNSLTDKVEQHFSTQAAIHQQLGNDDVLSFLLLKNSLWVGTSGGINTINLSSRPYTVIQQTHLFNSTIHTMQQDESDRFWISTNNGLVCFDPANNREKIYDTNDGLQNNEFTDGASFHSTTSEQLFFGGIDGLDIVYPSKVDTGSYFPNIALTAFQLHNVTIVPNDSSKLLTQHIDNTPALTLLHHQNFIGVNFTTLDYWNKQRTEYAYFLENFDSHWNFIGSHTLVTLTNIPPGSYSLYINAKSENGRWSPHPKKIKITVLPPFWKTSWAYAGYLFLGVSLQLGIVLYMRKRAKLKRAAAIEKMKFQQVNELNEYKLQFFTNVAHEFRTPLTLIVGPVIVLLKKIEGEWERYQLRTIYNNSLRLQKLIEELLQFRKIESGKENLEVIEIELVSFTQEIIESFYQHAHDHEVHLEFVPDSESLLAWVDPTKLEKILINLISNAIKYNTKGGFVQVKLQEQSKHALFQIRDSGRGIAKEDMSKIFEAFYQNSTTSNESSNYRASTGIGLSLTKSLVSVHKGQIVVDSTPKKGSTFSITIPIQRKAYEQNKENTFYALSETNLAEKVQQEFTNTQHRKNLGDVPSRSSNDSVSTILLVDDHLEIVNMLRSLLTHTYKIYTATNGEEALRILESERIDLVVSDIIMPGIDGLTLCQAIKDNIHTSHIPVILLTAKTEIENRIEGLQMGADSYIPKPFHPNHLFVRIEKLIESRQQIKSRFENLASLELSDVATGIGPRDDDFFKRITLSIETHLNDPDFSADVISDEIGMSKASLYKKVKATVGLTPHGLIKQYRLRKAADLLKNSTKSVSEVIYETGFNSRSYFYKSFNEMFHCHPKDYKDS